MLLLKSYALYFKLTNLIFFAFILVSCNQAKNGNESYFFPFDLDHPDNGWLLPDELHEISGMAFINDSILACVNDEDGVVFGYHILTGLLDTLVEFATYGDYEGLDFANNQYYIVSSTGTVFIADNDGVRYYSTPLNANNNIEGVCFYPAKNKLLLAAKGSPVIGRNETKTNKSVFSFDLLCKKLDSQPFISIEIEKSENNNKKSKNFKPSDIAYDIKSDMYYLVSAETRQLIVCNQYGDLLYATRLDKSYLNQPEGLCFDDKGNLYISSEGGKKNPARLFRYLRE